MTPTTAPLDTIPVVAGLPAVVSAEDAFAALGIDKTTGYRSVRAGTFPVPVIRVGRLIRFPRAALCQLIEFGNGDMGTDDDYRPRPTAPTANQRHRGAARPSSALHEPPVSGGRSSMGGGR